MNQENTNKKMITFLDSVGRLIFGVENTEKCTPEILSVKNPVILHIGDENGRMSVRLIPVIFREFLGDKSQECVVDYQKSVISLTNVDVFDFRLHSQYDQMFNPNNMFVPPQEQASPQQEKPKVVNLFDE